ncbi:protein MLP1-like [Sitophilus oryzae]|uniref:Protein MLP1-like n=1 Tax=Sitophilus oryzae TaxID=7048 RepID=A0A6J2YHR0_SITOR|nr:protein MLP1-like [Sitophilus oryzae]
MSSSIPESSGKECSTPRGYGEGDGFRQNISSRKRVPVSSARKFNARSPKDPTMRLKLETALKEMTGKRAESTPKRGQQCLLKSASVAEITPTSSKSKKRLFEATPDNSFEVYATPRFLDKSSVRRRCQNERFTCAIYRHLILLAWRRCRKSLSNAKDSIQRGEHQVSQLNMQINVLNELRDSEGQKRDETFAECKKLKKSIEILELENTQLIEEIQSHQMTMEILQNELKVSKSENNFLSDQTIKLQDVVDKMRSERKSLEEQLNLQKHDLSSQKKISAKLEAALQKFEKNFQTAELKQKTAEAKYAQLKCELQKQADTNSSLCEELQSVKEEKLDISLKVEELESKLDEYIESVENLKEINEELAVEMKEMTMELEEEKKHAWLRNTKEIALLSLSALQKIAKIILPAYLEINQSL